MRLHRVTWQLKHAAAPLNETLGEVARVECCSTFRENCFGKLLEKVSQNDRVKTMQF